MDLKKLIADFKKNAGVSQAEIESQIAQAKENELTKVQENANEVMHTTNTGFGAELIPVDQLTSEIINAIPNYASFVQALP
jgi:Sec-independent protein translocase protein TatA